MGAKKYIWQCPINRCQSRGIRPSTYQNARRNGMTHMRKTHHVESGEPIVKPVEQNTIVSTSFRKAIWICPLEGCACHGNKPMKRSRAAYHGKKHLQHYHGRNGEPDLLLFTRKTKEKTLRKEIRKALLKKGIKKSDIDVAKVHPWKPRK